VNHLQIVVLSLPSNGIQTVCAQTLMTGSSLDMAYFSYLTKEISCLNRPLIKCPNIHRPLADFAKKIYFFHRPSASGTTRTLHRRSDFRAASPPERSPFRPRSRRMVTPLYKVRNMPLCSRRTRPASDVAAKSAVILSRIQDTQGRAECDAIQNAEKPQLAPPGSSFDEHQPSFI
jgi:hypothetical protein